ncbi:MAG: hypothetical protein A2138_13275 [Deltaproteobacteria bacterium RBG_16_71_12]|nr:MAG: hypothetical protein A2138_13275 [Deltaproteobacteria bacterium RBG_16_71_12]
MTSDVIDAARLAQCAMLEGVSLAARGEILREGRTRHVQPGATLIKAGTDNKSMFFILEGKLGVFLEGLDGAEPVAVLGAGETVGELSLLDGSVASANVVASEPSLLLELDERAFWGLVNAAHAFAVNLLAKLAERLRSNNDAVSKNVQQRQRYERAAMFDGLTGIHNRRWLDETLHRLAERHRVGPSSRGQASDGLSVGLVDIDHFKLFNDRYGHDAGDHVLTLVAGTLAKNLRPTDLVARFGGEEFVLLFPGTDLETAGVAAERVRAVVEVQEAKLPNGTVLPCVTISVGIAHLVDGQSVADLLKTADLAMYQAKKSGRNRVVLGREPVRSARE